MEHLDTISFELAYEIQEHTHDEIFDIDRLTDIIRDKLSYLSGQYKENDEG